MDRPEHPLDVLRAFDRLEVGPVRLETRRLRATYTVHVGAEQRSSELVYRYEEDVFTPDDPGCENLGAMIAAQVALNYGLFCDEIVLHGSLDHHDRRMLRAMAENTAREIYVKKFLEPNPFLVGEATRIEAIPAKRYCRARLTFDGKAEPTEPWQTDRGRHAVLSSGGKDSLLSHGLLTELSHDSHPIFVNESGRHWYTALNAYRFFRQNVPNTARVWTNADRLFSWMLRQLPFVRQDFARVRSDEYPIRLWTVAVFEFGALPLIRKRGIGRLVIGDEYDCTTRRSHHGITHYDGLYDQSRYFDEAMSRYFHAKGWALVQFSILRTMSEMLIERVLVERYPDLQNSQVSCHATHIEGDRVRPCGRCEKCRRIVGMLLALDADPRRCGYDDEQIRRCLELLIANGVNQESAGAEQLEVTLREKGILPAAVEGDNGPRPHPEILGLRIDAVRSPLEGMPVDLREPLFRLLLQHADGARQRRGRIWIEIDLLANPGLTTPYRFEPVAPPVEPEGDEQPYRTVRPWLLGELTWPEAARRFAEMDVALLPVGAVEQHGPHLPLDTDAFDARYLAAAVAEACSEPHPLVLPAVSYGVSYHHEDFAGTISVGSETLSRLVYDIGMAAARHGTTKLVIVNGHGGNAPALQLAAQRINEDGRIFTCVDTGETSDADLDGLCETPNDVHAGEIETSTALAIRPHLVAMELASAFVPSFSSQYLDFTARRRVEWYARTRRLSRNGVLGDPTRGSADKGRRMWSIMIRNLVELVEDLKRLSLDEIYERRY